jgi:hypothetical protein
MKEREVMQALIKQHLYNARDRMKCQADKGHFERSFQIGEYVYLKLQSYVQSSLTARSNKKLSFKFFGPFLVLAKIGAVAYRLGLSDSSSIHPVFHVSQLKKAIGTQLVSTDLPRDSTLFQVPVCILERRMSSGDRPVLQELIQWSGMPAHLATWENLEALRQRFPDASTWGQVESQEGRNVSSPTTDPAQSEQAPRPKRAIKPSVRVNGPEWCN